MQIIEITDKRQWNDFISAQKYAQFLQSWQWGEFHKKMGRQVWRLAVADDGSQCKSELMRSRDMINLPAQAGRASAMDECTEKIPLSLPSSDGTNAPLQKRENILMAMQVIKYELPFGQSYLYCPRGPSLVKSLKLKACTELAERVKSEGINLLFKKIKELAQQEKSIFFRLEPMEDNELKVIKWKVNKVKSVQPKKEWFLDLGKTEDELLKEMQQKTRYNIRLAEKKGVQIRVACLNDNSSGRSDGKDDFDKFWNLISATYNRKQIRTHSKEYYKGILEIGWEANRNIKNCGAAVKLWLAEYQGKVVAANIISYFGDTATYMHGGADYEARNLMAPHLLQWKIIKDAKMKGYKYYDFGGCSETNSYWQGITRFKKGFGGFELDYNGTYEIGFKRFLYKLYSFAKKLRAASNCSLPECKISKFPPF